MTAPRRILPGKTYLITRRCHQRQYLLRPSALVNDVLLFALAVTAARHGIQVHAYCFLSNHFHLVITDPNALLPRFQQDLNAMVARALNASLGRRNTFWASRYSALWLVEPEAAVRKAAYTLANPVAAGLVRYAEQWPGLWSNPESFGTTLEIKRPRHFFAEDGDLPESATLTLTAAPGLGSTDQFRDQVIAELAEREALARSGPWRRFLGVAGVLSQSPFSQPKTVEPLGALSPRVAAKDKWVRIAALAELAEFVRAYRVAWTARRAGRTDVLFPAGTYLLRVAHGVACVT